MILPAMLTELHNTGYNSKIVPLVLYGYAIIKNELLGIF